MRVSGLQNIALAVFLYRILTSGTQVILDQLFEKVTSHLLKVCSCFGFYFKVFCFSNILTESLLEINDVREVCFYQPLCDIIYDKGYLSYLFSNVEGLLLTPGLKLKVTRELYLLVSYLVPNKKYLQLSSCLTVSCSLSTKRSQINNILLLYS